MGLKVGNKEDQVFVLTKGHARRRREEEVMSVCVMLEWGGGTRNQEFVSENSEFEMPVRHPNRDLSGIWSGLH